MRANYQRLGNYIRQVDVRNKAQDVSLLLGLSIEKKFIPSIANTIGTDMSSYKIVAPMQFAYVPVTSRNGDKITIALYKGEEKALISQAYTAFEITNVDALLPDYLMLWFKRPEFDRYARFKSHGSAREVFDWDEMCNVMLPVPPIEEQRRIVAQYQAVETRIRNNERLIARLEDTAQAFYHHRFVDYIDPNNLPDGWKMATIEDFGKVITGKTPSSDNPEDFGDETPFVTPGDFWNYEKFAIGAERGLSIVGTKRLQNKLLPSGAVMVTCIGSDMGKIAVATEECITNQQLNSIVPYQKAYTDYLFYSLLLKTNELKSMALGASTMPMLNKGDFEKINILMPSYELLVEFTRLLLPLNNMVIMKLKENALLSEANAILINQL